MSTRGVYGFRKNGEDKITYNHYDSYPDGLGRAIVEFCQETSVGEMKEIFDRVVLVSEGSEPTDEQIADCRGYEDLSVSSKSEKDWYCLLRSAQGNMDAYKNGLNYMIDSKNFIHSSLFCEYGYIINLDSEELEFWSGFQHRPQKNNRYGNKRIDGYYPCKLTETFPLKSLSDETVSFMQKLI